MERASRYFEVLEIQKNGVYTPIDYHMSQSRVDSLINRLLKGTTCSHAFIEPKTSFRDWDRSVSYDTFESEINELCLATRDILLKEPSLLELKAPIKIAGNFHGQFNTLMSVFERDGLPPQSNYLFLGNYGDIEGSSLETALLLFAFKIKYPNNVFLLRGNHDGVSLRHLLIDEVELQEFLIEESVIRDCLKSLPVAALIDNKILCTHGGLSPDLHNLDQIRHITRPAQMPNSGLLRDLLGSDPIMAYKVKHHDNTFDSKKVQKFLVEHDLRLIFCANKIVGGYKVYAGQRGAMICSASKQPEIEFDDDASARICSASRLSYFMFDDAGAMMSVDENLLYSFHILKPKHGHLDYSFMAATTHSESSSGVNLTNKYGEDPPLEQSLLSGSSTGDASSRSKMATKYTSVFTSFKRFLGAG